MWQRKQTVFLAIVVLCMGVSVLFPIWTATTDGVVRSLFPLHYTVQEGDVRDTVYFPYSLTAILSIAAATVAFMEIRRFDNRLLQIKLGALNSLLMAGSIASAVYFATNLIKENQIAGEYGLAFVFPAIAMISNIVANRFIRRDEKLVRDSERIR